MQHVPNEGSGAIGAALRARGIEERVVRTYLGETVPQDLADARGLLVMGGPMGVYEADQYPHLRDEMRLIEGAIAKNMPVLGVCLGSQLVAAALGARVERAARREVGWREVRLREAAHDDPLWAGSPSMFTPLHWHGDIFELPRGAVSLASSEQTEHQAFRFGTSTWAILFHMEMNPEQIDGMATAFPEDLVETRLSRDDVVACADARVSDAAPIAARVFGAWADLLRARSEYPTKDSRSAP